MFLFFLNLIQGLVIGKPRIISVGCCALLMNFLLEKKE